MNLKGMKTAAQNLGLTYDGTLQYMPLAYGVMEGFTVALYLDMFTARNERAAGKQNFGGFPWQSAAGRNASGQSLSSPGQLATGSYSVAYKLSVAVRKSEEKPQHADLKELCKGAPCPVKISRISEEDFRITFELGITGNKGWPDLLERGIRYLILTLKANGYENCDEKTGIPAETKACFIEGGVPRLLTKESFEDLVQETEKSFGSSAPVNVSLFRELGASVIVSAVFAVFITVLGRITGMLFWIFVAIVLNYLAGLFCRICGTRKESAANPRGFRILEVFMALTVVFAERLSIALPAYFEYRKTWEVSFGLLFLHLEDVLTKQGLTLYRVMTVVNLLLVLLILGGQYRQARFRKLHNRSRILGDE